MPTVNAVVLVDGLTEAEVFDLQRAVDETNVVRSDATDRPSQRFGSLDAATAAVVISGFTAATLATWLLKHRVRKETLKIVVRHPDGTEETREFTVSDEQKADAAIFRTILDQMTSWFGSLLPGSGQ